MAYIEREELLGNLKQFAPEHLTPLIVNLIQKTARRRRGGGCKV